MNRRLILYSVIYGLHYRNIYGAATWELNVAPVEEFLDGDWGHVVAIYSVVTIVLIFCMHMYNVKYTNGQSARINYKGWLDIIANVSALCIECHVHCAGCASAKETENDMMCADS